MTFEPKKFTTLGGHLKSGIAFQKFGYLGNTDDLATIKADGYFNETRNSLRRNDIIEVLDKVTVPNEFVTLVVTGLPTNGDVTTEEISLGITVPVESVFGRVGDVVAESGDYSASLVDNDSSVIGFTVKDALETLDSDIGDVASDVTDIQSDLSHKNTFVITETNGKIDNIVINGDTTVDFNYDVYGMFSSITDGTNTWNLTNDKNGGEIRVVA